MLPSVYAHVRIKHSVRVICNMICNGNTDSDVRSEFTRNRNEIKYRLMFDATQMAVILFNFRQTTLSFDMHACSFT